MHRFGTVVLALVVPSVSAVLALLPSRVAFAWGEKGHGMTARVAVRKLPKDMPAFFRAAEVELGYLCSEPDRWRNERREPALEGATDQDHDFWLEDAKLPLPPNRAEFLLQYVGKPKPNGEGTVGYRDLGRAPYAIAEPFEMLTVNFMLWREAPEGTPHEKRIKRQIEQNIVYVAGVAGHFVTDGAMPLHTTIHGDGWDERRAENKKGYTGRRQALHRRFEKDYVDRVIGEGDFESLVATLRQRGPWLEAALEHMQETHKGVEPLYELEKAAPFGGGNETPAHKKFVCECLAHASSALRDFWYSAWVKSASLRNTFRGLPGKKTVVAK